MVEIASAYVTLLPSAKGFGSKLTGAVGGDIEKAGRQGGSRYGKVFASASMSPIRAIGAAALGLFAVNEVKNFLSSSIGEAREAQKVSALTAQVIKTTGGAAQISAAQVGNLANAISKKVGIDDEAIQSGENMLLTFTNVRNEVGKGNKVFNQATRLAVDMSTALGGDAKSAALQLGKALNDPAKGVTKLARSGVSFTEQQVKQIKAMQESGNLLGAQKIILGEVSKEFGGAAAAQATAGEKLSVAFGNLKESIGTAMLPLIDRFAGLATGTLVPAMSQVLGILANRDFTAGPFSEDSGIVNVLFRLRDGFTTVAGVAKQAFNILFHGDFTGGPLAEDNRSVDNLFKLRDALAQLGAFVRDVAAPALMNLARQVLPILSTGLGVAFGFIANNQAVVATFAGVILTVATAVKVWTIAQAALNFVLTANPIGIVVVALAGLAAGLVYAYKRSETFRNIVNAAFSVVRGVVTAVAGFVSKYVPRAFAILVAGVRTYIGIYRAVVVGAFNTVKAVITTVGAVVVGAVKFYARLVSGVREKVGQIVSIMKGLPGKAISALGDLGSTLFHSGQALLAGFARGITSKIGEVYSAAKGALDKVRNLFPHSPAKEGPFSGKGWTLHSGISLMQGLADGISRSKGKVKSAIVQVLDAVRQQVKQVSSSVSQAFGGDLFSATNAVSFVQNLTKTNGVVGRLKTAFARLLKWGWRPDALSALFQSGNSALILSLASSQALATQASRQYQSVQSNLTGLGNTVANTQYSLSQDRTIRKFDDLIAAVKSVGIDVGVEINGAAKKGKRKHR